jgi:Aldolase/RraA
MTFATTGLCDDHPQQLEDARLVVLPPVFQHFGQRVRFCGRVTTLKVFEDNTLVRAALEAPGNGNVLVSTAAAACARHAPEAQRAQGCRRLQCTRLHQWRAGQSGRLDLRRRRRRPGGAAGAGLSSAFAGPSRCSIG